MDLPHLLLLLSCWSDVYWVEVSVSLCDVFRYVGYSEKKTNECNPLFASPYDW